VCCGSIGFRYIDRLYKMAAGVRGILVALSFYVFIYRQLYVLNSVSHPELNTQNSKVYENISFIITTEISSLIGFNNNINNEIEWTPNNVNIKKSLINIRSTSKHLIMLFLLKSGDVHPQPISQKKPKQPKFPCTICREGVISTSKAVDCDHCQKWTHVKCTSSITVTQYDKWVNENTNFSFICNECSIRCLPFYLSEIPDDDQKSI